MGSHRGNFLIAQGGGPTAVINASLAGAVLEGMSLLHPTASMWGARAGIQGFLDQDFIDLRATGADLWKAIGETPAAALKSCRRKITAEDIDSITTICREKDIRYFFYIGGNDSMDTANKVALAAKNRGHEMFVAGIPKTIDNDLAETDFCPGYGSCARFIAQSTLDLGMDIRSLPTPVSIMEVIGRNAGWTAAAAMLAREGKEGAPHLIYVPEIPLSKDKFLKDIQEVHKREGWVVAVVSEGVCDEKGESLSSSAGEVALDGFGHKLPGDVASALANLVIRELGLRARSEKPGLIARASSHHVSDVDRGAAEAVGRFAVQSAIQGNSGFMASIRRTDNNPLVLSYEMAPLEKVAEVERFLPREYLNKEKNHIAESFRSYVEPLIGPPLRRYPRLVGC